MAITIEQIKADKKFDAWLYGGFRDLDEPVIKLIYNLYSSGIKTILSCSGHIGSFIQSSEKSAIKEHYAFDCGRLYYEDSPESEPLEEKLRSIVRNHNFARLETDKDYPEFILDMEDIAIPCDIRGKGELQVPIKKAKARYNDFLKIWADLTKWSEKRNSQRRPM